MRSRRRLSTLVAMLSALALTVAIAAPEAGATATPRVFGGSATSVPGWMGFFAAVEGTNAALCGGTAIAPNVVLTADHCVIDEATNQYVPPNMMFMVFGQTDPRGSILNHTAAPVGIVRYASPSQFGVYANGITQNDISLLELSRPAPATISLVPTNRPSLWAGGRTGTVLGWGLTNASNPNSAPSQLLSAPMPIESDGYCRARWPNFNSTYMMCAGDGTGPAPCQGDSGGPLIVSDGGSGIYEAGVVNTGTLCQNVGAADIFARVGGPVLGNWIAKYAAQLQSDANARGFGPAPAAVPAPSAPAATTPAAPKAPATPVPGPIRSELWHALTSSMGARVAKARGLRTACHAQASDDYMCTATWFKRPNDYRATVEIFPSAGAASTATPWDYTGSFRSVNHRCATGRHRSRCAVTRASLS